MTAVTDNGQRTTDNGHCDYQKSKNRPPSFWGSECDRRIPRLLSE